MCGIFGFVGNRDRAASIDLDVALKSLHHRGPDDRGTWFGISKAHRETACAFAHTRLAIIDVTSAGHQPMTTDDGRYTIVYNGEIYNFREIRAELQELGCRFSSNCDTEVVLKAYVRWGRDCVQRLRGMFAFAIWDEELGSLFIARDRLGIKPLYYARTPAGFAFASEVRVLMNCGLAERRLSREGLSSYLAFGSVYEPFTIVDGVMALLPGCVAVTDGKEMQTTTYWSIADTHRDSRQVDVRSALRSAILSELEADVPVGIFLSGGIDSSAIVSIAASAARQPVHTFTVTFDESAYNEEKHAAEVASRYGCDYHQVHLSADAALSEIDKVLVVLEQPSADGVNTYFIAKAARASGLSVALSGLGGDEVFAGYRNFRSFGPMLALGKAAAPFTRFFGSERSSAFGKVSTRVRKTVAVMRAGGNPSRTYAALRSMFDDQQVSALQSESHRSEFAAENAVASCGNGDDKVNLFGRLELANYLRNTLLCDADVMSMAHSLEVRVPLLDHILLEGVLRIPGAEKLSSSVNKPLLVKAADALPSSIVHRPKMGFLLPLEEWLRGPFNKRAAELLNTPGRRGDSILDFAAVAEVWRAFMQGKRYMNYSRVWCLAALIAWSAENRVVGQ
jgi:asparagine synthase (glutamine-hydrolysing)